MEIKKYLSQLALTIILCLGMIIGVNYYFDPLSFFNVKTPFDTLYYKPLYHHAGLIKNQPYDSVIIDTSYMQNMRPDFVMPMDSMKNPLKIPLPGASGKEITYILEKSLMHRLVKTVLYGLDLHILYKNYMRLPLYLYDNSRINDAPYWFSFDTFKRSILNAALGYGLKDTHFWKDPQKRFEWHDEQKHRFFKPKKRLK